VERGRPSLPITTVTSQISRQPLSPAPDGQRHSEFVTTVVVQLAFFVLV